MGAAERARAARSRVLPRLDTYEEDGALWARTTAYGDDKDRVLMRSNGTPTYFAADVVYLVDKLERGFDRAIYVLGADHHGYVATGTRRSRACSATTPSASRCCSTSSST